MDFVRSVGSMNRGGTGKRSEQCCDTDHFFLPVPAWPALLIVRPVPFPDDRKPIPSRSVTRTVAGLPFGTLKLPLKRIQTDAAARAASTNALPFFLRLWSAKMRARRFVIESGMLEEQSSSLPGRPPRTSKESHSQPT